QYFAWSADGRFVAAQAADTVCVWEVASGAEQLRADVRSLAVKLGPHGLALSPDGRRLACSGVGKNGDVLLWDVPGRSLLRKLDPAGKRSYVAGVQFSRDGRCLYVGCGNGALVTWDMRTGEEHKRLQGAPCELRFLAFNLDGTRLAYAAFGSGVHLSDLETGR